MILIGVLNIILGYCSYTKPSDVHERILLDVANARGSSAAAGIPAATGCAPAITARIETNMPGATIIACTPEHVAVLRGEHRIDLEVVGGDIVAISETLTLPEIPAAVMRAFAVAYPRTIPSGAVKRTRRGAAPTYELGFPPGAAHHVATLHADGTVIGLR